MIPLPLGAQFVGAGASLVAFHPPGDASASHGKLTVAHILTVAEK
jgi:hypothetical protein